MNCLVLDDDNVSRIALEEITKQTGTLDLIASCEKVSEALKAINQNEIDRPVLK